MRFYSFALPYRLRRKRGTADHDSEGSSAHHHEQDMEEDVHNNVRQLEQVLYVCLQCIAKYEKKLSWFICPSIALIVPLQAFDKISTLMRNMGEDQINGLDLKMLMDLMERSARGEKISFPAVITSPSSSPSKIGSFQTNATLPAIQMQRPLGQVHAKADAKHQLDDEDAVVTGVGAGSEDLNLVDLRPPMQRAESFFTRQTLAKEKDKDSMAGEVRRIAQEYNEEKQKLDLNMKIKETRQRQALQRKLFEKSQRKAQQMRNGVGDEYAPTGDFDDDGEGGDSTAAGKYDSVNIGANRGLANMKLRQPSNLQPAFKGLPAEAYGSPNPSALGAGSLGMRAQNQQSMASRGLNLGPMMRK